jgi:hypothetical protein
MCFLEKKNARRVRWLVVLLALVVLLGGSWTVAQAAPPAPPTFPILPVPQQATPQLPAAVPSSPNFVSGLPALKAVLIVGPIDEEDGYWTAQETTHMELAAAELEAHGVTVYRFYAPNNDWNEITAAAEGAHFLFYRGHGVYWSPMPNPKVGGFSLQDRMVTPDEIRKDLRLAPNAVVMLYGCFTAGSANNDVGSISSEEARRRVAEYSGPFVAGGASGYFANWYGDAFQRLVRSLFEGKTLGETYETFYDYNSATVERFPYPLGPNLEMWLDGDNWWGDWQYNYAFVGRPGQTLLDLFGLPEMVVKPAGIFHLTERDSQPKTFELHVGNEGPGQFSWTVTAVPRVEWLSVQSVRGASGEDLQIEITATDLKPGTYETSIRITADDASVQNGDQTIPLTVRVRKRLHSGYLPAIYGPAE